MVSFFSPVSYPDTSCLAILTSDRRVDLSGLILNPLLVAPDAECFFTVVTTCPQISFLFLATISASSSAMFYILYLAFPGGDPSDRQTDSSSSEINSMMSLVSAASLGFPILAALLRVSALLMRTWCLRLLSSEKLTSCIALAFVELFCMDRDRTPLGFDILAIPKPTSRSVSSELLLPPASERCAIELSFDTMLLSCLMMALAMSFALNLFFLFLKASRA